MPVFAWLPSLGVSNITVLEGFHASWTGDLLVASLAARSLYRVRTTAGRVVFIEQIYVGERIRYAHFHKPDNQIYLWTDSHNILVLAVAEHQSLTAIIDRVASSRGLSRAQKSVLRTHMLDCAQCHSLNSTLSIRAPSLPGIVGAPLAASSYTEYSAALRDVGGSWSEQKLQAFLRNPQALAPGTTMPNPGIREQVIVDSVVDVLRQLEQN